MVCVTLFYDRDREIRGYSLFGHAGMDEKGKDIVCASLSMMAINTANALEKLTDSPVQIVCNEEEALLDVRVREKPDEKAITLLKAMELACEELQKDTEYHLYISLTREEIDS